MSTLLTCEVGSATIMRFIPTGLPIPACPPQPIETDPIVPFDMWDYAFDTWDDPYDTWDVLDPTYFEPVTVCQVSGSSTFNTNGTPCPPGVIPTLTTTVTTTPTPGATVMRTEPI